MDGDEFGGEYQVELVIKAKSEPGTWNLAKLMLADKAGNVDSNALEAAGLNKTVTVQVK